MRETNRSSGVIVPTIAGLRTEAETGVPQEGGRVAYKEAACLLLLLSSSSSYSALQILGSLLLCKAHFSPKFGSGILKWTSVSDLCYSSIIVVHRPDRNILLGQYVRDTSSQKG